MNTSANQLKPQVPGRVAHALAGYLLHTEAGQMQRAGLLRIAQVRPGPQPAARRRRRRDHTCRVNQWTLLIGYQFCSPSPLIPTSVEPTGPGGTGASLRAATTNAPDHRKVLAGSYARARDRAPDQQFSLGGGPKGLPASCAGTRGRRRPRRCAPAPAGGGEHRYFAIGESPGPLHPLRHLASRSGCYCYTCCYRPVTRIRAGS